MLNGKRSRNKKNIVVLLILIISIMGLSLYLSFLLNFSINIIIIGSVMAISAGVTYHFITTEGYKGFRKRVSKKSKKTLNGEFLSENTKEIINELINEMPEVKNYIESIAPDKDVPVLEFRNAQDILLDIKNRFFSVYTPEELRKIDLIEMPRKEKKQFIKELLSLEPNERRLLIDNILKNKSF